MLKRLLVLSVVAAGTASAAKAEPIVIDNFGSPSSQVEYQIDLLTAGSNVYSQTHSVGNGLTRTTTVVVTDPANPDFNSASGTIGQGAFSMATNDNTNAYATLAYSGFAGAGLSDFSLHSALQLSFRKVDSGLTTDQLPYGVVVRTATGSFTLPSSSRSSGP